MRGIVFNLLNERLRANHRTDGWDWLTDEDDPIDEEALAGEIQCDASVMVLPLEETRSFAESFYWPSVSPRSGPRRPN
jgi:hypothetical protein